MIRAFNTKQNRLALLAAILCLFASAATFLIMWGLWRYLAHAFEFKTLSGYGPVFAAIFLVVTWCTGFSLWSRGFGHQDFLDSPFASSFDSSSGGAMWMNYQLAEAKGCSYSLSQLALAAPLQGFKAYDLLRSRIEDTAEMRVELELILDKIRSNGKWHSIDTYPHHDREVLYLARMGKIDYSEKRGAIRIADEA